MVFLELLTTEYDVATANPPYTDSADFGPDLKTFIDDNYKSHLKENIKEYATSKFVLHNNSPYSLGAIARISNNSGTLDKETKFQRWHRAFFCNPPDQPTLDKS